MQDFVDDGVVLLAPEEESVPESAEHERLVDLLCAGIAARFHDVEDVAVHCRLAWFPDREDTRIRLDPDVMVVFGRPATRRRSYRQWAEDGVPPTVLLEVLSEEDTDADYDRRLRRARRYGVAEVVLIAPFTPGGVRVDHLLPDPDDAERFRTRAVSTAPDLPVHVERLGISLAGGRDLAARDSAGGSVWLDTPALARRVRTEAARADAQAARADAQAARADAEAARADAESARAKRLAEQLRQAGIDPDAD
jgi:Uma2 family endonuclease